MPGPKQEQQPARPGVDEVAAGIIRAQLPLWMPGLGHINSYFVPDKRGVAVIDPGMPGAETYEELTSRLAQAGFQVTDVHTVLITHSHPDHFGGAGRLAYEADADLVTHSAFRLWWSEDPLDPCEQIHDVDALDLAASNPWEGPTPWGTPAMPRPERSSLFPPEHFRTPAPTIRLKDGDRIVLGDREWWAVHTPGHTLDHLCLFDAEGGVFLSGDHVLPQITPHISGIAAGRDPVAMFVSSLDKVAALPEVRVVLPAHGLEFDDLQGRVDGIKHHHEERLDKVVAIGTALGPSVVEGFTHELFRPEVWGQMADSETYAHLEHLRLVGRAERTEDGEGRAVFRILA